MPEGKQIKRRGAASDEIIPHSVLFPNAGCGRYPEGAPCPGHANLPPGIRRGDLVSDGKGGWIVKRRAPYV